MKTDTDLETETDEQENEVQDDETNSNEEGEASEGTEDESSEEESSEGGGQSEGGSDQEAGRKKSNQRSAQHRVSSRIRKLKGDLSQSESGNESLKNELAIANQRIEIMKLAGDRKGADKKLVEPNPDDFEEGIQDRKYFKAIRDFDRAQTRLEIKQEFADQSKTNQQTTSTDNLQRDKERKQREHYRRAIEGNSDYEEKEDALTEILGQAAIKDIINEFDDSDKIIYQLGADQDMAYKVLDAMEAKNHVLAVRLLERASKGLKVKPKSNKTTPDPDTVLEGGSPSSSKKKRGPKGATFT